MQIIIKGPEVTDEMVDAAIHKEVLATLQEDRLTGEREREIMAAAEAEAIREQKTHPVFGKCVAVIPARDYFRLRKKYGPDEVVSDEFLRYFNKRNPHLSPNRA